MMSNKKIVVTIDPCGRPTIEAVGFTGVSCKDATKALEARFGASTTEEKPEMYMEEQTGIHLQQ